jgi:hypothetical protein
MARVLKRSALSARGECNSLATSPLPGPVLGPVDGMPVRFSGPYLTIAEAAQLARLTPKRLRNLMAAGVLREGIHFSRPRGLRPRIFRDSLLAWLQGAEQFEPAAVPRRRSGGPRCKVDLSIVGGVTRGPDGL